MKTNKDKLVQQVFINCPFDSAYNNLFRTLVFTLCYLDHYPVFSETTSSTDFRLKTIVNLIRHSQLGVHDLSRHSSNNAGEMSRFNLPFELGLDIGSKLFGGKNFVQNKIIVLDHSPHEYDKYLGDLSGQDIIVHHNDSRSLMKEIRNWISRIYPDQLISGSDSIWRAYSQFKKGLQKKLKSTWSQQDIRNLQKSEYRKYAAEWIKKQENDEMIR